jgi:hypothetical protein
MKENSFFEDFLVIIGILPIIRSKRLEQNEIKFLKDLTKEERKQNRIDTEELLKLVNQVA